MALLQYLNRINKPKVAIPSKLVSLSECQLQQENNYIYEKLGDEVTTSGIGKKWHYQYKYSAKEKVDIGKYFSEVLWPPYLLRHLGNTRTLKTANLSAYKK